MSATVDELNAMGNFTVNVTDTMPGTADPSAQSLFDSATITAEAVADATIEGLRRESFLILPHPNVATYVARKAENYDRWLGGMAKLRRSIL